MNLPLQLPRGRVLLGFVVAPLAAPIALDLMTSVEGVASGATPTLGVLGALFLVGFMAPYAYLAMLVVGLPAYVLLRRYAALRLEYLLLAGAVAAAFFAPTDTTAPARAMILFVAAGAASGLVFWLFVREAPERPGAREAAA